MNGKHVVLVGAGGNIGSFAVGLLARMPEIARLTLIDPGSYETKDLNTQEIGRDAVARPKVHVQAERARNIRSDLKIEPLWNGVESVPLGQLRSDLILTGLDSRRARMVVNRMALRLGLPWIDAGVLGEDLLARVTRYRPGLKAACLQCGWDHRDYAAVDTIYSCLSFEDRPLPTNAPASLGALAASLLAIECGKALSHRPSSPDYGLETVVDANHRVLRDTAHGRDPACRVREHCAWEIERLDRTPDDITLAEAFDLGTVNGRGPAHGLQVEGSPFVRRLACPGCGHSEALFRHLDSILPSRLECPGCCRRMAAVGFEMVERLEPDRLPDGASAWSLKQLGLGYGEVFGVGDSGREKHFELAPPPDRWTRTDEFPLACSEGLTPRTTEILETPHEVNSAVFSN